MPADPFQIDNLKIGVIGLGYVGLPLAVEFGRLYPTVGFDVKEARIAELEAGRDSTLECSPEELQRAERLPLHTNLRIEGVGIDPAVVEGDLCVSGLVWQLAVEFRHRMPGNVPLAIRQIDRQLARISACGSPDADAMSGENLETHLASQQRAIATEKFALMAAVELPRLSDRQDSGEFLLGEEYEMPVVEEVTLGRRLRLIGIWLGGLILLAAALGSAVAVNPNLAYTVGGYIVLTTAYSSWLKHVAVVDLVAVAAGFVLRAVAGAAATEVPISDWFFIVTSFGALFMISGKRAAEAKEMGDEATDFRSVLGAYSPSYTAYLRAVTSGAVLVAYCLWAFEKAEIVTDVPVPWFQLSILPFVMGLLRYALVLDQGRGSAPEEIVLGDRPLQLIGVAWAVVFAIGVYTA